MKQSQSGFALVLVAALVAAVLLLLLALTTLNRANLRASAQRGASERARAYALAGLRVAIGRLQQEAGPDQRSTATAQHLGARNRHWTGVWRDSGGPVWLVSGQPTSADISLTTAGPMADSALLVGPASTPVTADAVAAPWEQIEVSDWPGLAGSQVVGRFAFWVGDQGVKGHVGIADRVEEVPVSTLPDAPLPTVGARARIRQLLAHRSGNDALNLGGDPPTGGMMLQAEDDPASAVRWGLFAVATMVTQLRFQELATSAATDQYRSYLRRHFHDFTVCSRGVLANAATGGLRRNYSDLYSPEVPEAVKDMERYRPVGARLPIVAGMAPTGGAVAPIKPVLTELALDFVLYREESGNRLLAGCRLRVELWNPYNLPLARPASGSAPDFEVRFGGRRTASPGDTGLPVIDVWGLRGLIGRIDLRDVLPPGTVIPLSMTADLPAGTVTILESVVCESVDTGLVIPDPEAGEVPWFRWVAGTDTGRSLSLNWGTAGDSIGALGDFSAFPSSGFVRDCNDGWSVTGDQPWADASAAAAAILRLGVSYHFAANPAWAAWADWLAPAATDLRSPEIEYKADDWVSVRSDPAASALAVGEEFRPSGLYSAGERHAPFDFTCQRNLSIGVLDQLVQGGLPPLAIGNPWGGAANSVFDEAYFNPVPADWQPSDRLPGVRYHVLEDMGADAVKLGGVGAARYLGADGMMNANSVSPEAWSVLLGRTVCGWEDAAGGVRRLENPFFGFAHSAPFAASDAQGVRCLSDASVQSLAGEIAARVAARPLPFRSLAELVNSGLLQQAIDAVGLNTLPDGCADIGGVPAPYSANYLTQAGLLHTIAPLLAVRSDTFVVRVAAQAVNPALPAADAARVEARAWCEAVVQRSPEYVDSGEDPFAWPPTNADNITLGRRFQVVAFRWLGPLDL